jgi:hypothetical protein
MVQTHDGSTQNLAEWLCWQVARGGRQKLIVH